MKIDYNVPFYANTPDDTHCFQAALRSILKFFMPDRDFSWQELDEATAKVEDMWTWPMAGLIWMKQLGFEVINIEDFDFQQFINDKEKYLASKYGSEVAAIQVKNSDLSQEIGFAKQFLDDIDTKNRSATQRDVMKYLKAGFLVAANVNAAALNDQSGYVGHFVVVKGVDDEGLVIHDPGSPPIKNRHLSFEKFDKSWAYPSPAERNLVAFKK